mmetsp:Transcript_55855/g.92778  ORF Transcript_55855/g.92778 Transcript_55855/m.92778 type:complete len:98 (+) Transcript_55855:215-508(+)
MPPSTSSPSLSLLLSSEVRETEVITETVVDGEGRGDRVGNMEGVTGFEGGGLLKPTVSEGVLDADGVGGDDGETVGSEVATLDAEGSLEGEDVGKEV